VFVANALQQIVEVDIFASHAFEGGDSPVEHVIAPTIDAGTFNRQCIECFFDHTYHRRLSVGITTDYTQFLITDKVTANALAHLLFDCQQGISECHNPCLRGAENVKCQARSAFGTNPGQAPQFFDKSGH